MANVLIFGATSAIAQAVAQRYAARGDRLYVVGRNPAKLDALVQGLGSACVGSMVADLDDTDANARRVGEAIDTLGSIDIGLVAHGLLGDQIETERSWESAEAVLRTNLLSVGSLTIPQHAHHQAEDRPFVAPHDLRERVFTAREGVLHQRRIVDLSKPRRRRRSGRPIVRR